MTLSDRDTLIYAALGFSVWLSGALEFRWFGQALLESGPGFAVLTAIFVAIAVCLIFRTTMNWRGTTKDLSVTVAVVMALPGLFGEAVRQLLFVWATGLKPQTEPAFAAIIFFGNAVLLAYALFRQRNALKAQR